MMAFLLGSLLLAATCVAVVVYALAFVAFEGWCAAKLWLWFIVPLGHSPVPWSLASGVMLILAIPLIGLHRKTPEFKTTTEKVTAVLIPWCGVGSILCIGYVIRWLAR